MNLKRLGLVQCRSVFTETMDRHKRSLSHIDCMFKKSRYCDCK